MSKIDENYKFLQEYYPEHAQELMAEQQEVEKAMLIADVQNHDGVKQLIEMLNRLVAEADNSLLNDEKLDQMGNEATQKRRDIKTRREVYKWFIRLFQDSREAVRAAEASTDQKLKEIKDYENPVESP